MSLLLKATTLGVSWWFSLAPHLLRDQRFLEKVNEPLPAETPIAPLRSGVVGDDSHDASRCPAPQSYQELMPGRLRKGIGSTQVKDERGPSRGSIGMLTTRTTGRVKRPYQFGFRDYKAADVETSCTWHILTVLGGRSLVTNR